MGLGIGILLEIETVILETHFEFEPPFGSFVGDNFSGIYMAVVPLPRVAIPTDLIKSKTWSPTLLVVKYIRRVQPQAFGLVRILIYILFNLFYKKANNTFST